MVSPQASIPRLLTSTITPDLLEMIEFLYLIVADICTIHKYLRGK